MFGLRPYDLRVLTDDPWIGGLGHPIESVANMTIDQVLFLLTDKKYLKGQGGRTRTVKTVPVGKDGMASGKAADGTPIRAKVGGQSKVQMLWEQKQKRETQKNQPKKRRRRGGK